MKFIEIGSTKETEIMEIGLKFQCPGKSLESLLLSQRTCISDTVTVRSTDSREFKDKQLKITTMHVLTEKYNHIRDKKKYTFM